MTNPHAISDQANHLSDICIQKDPLLNSYRDIIIHRLQKIMDMEARLTGEKTSLADFAAGHEFFGLHLNENEWVFREWAPNADAIYLIGEITRWLEIPEYRLRKISAEGVWEIRLPADALEHQELYRLRIHWPGGSGDRIPAYARRVVQDPVSEIFNAQVWQPPRPYVWKNEKPAPDINGLLVYEAHIGMAQEDECVGSFKQFEDNILPRIIHAGYNTIQLMAVQEHPYYGSFGYHVSNFFALSSRFGTPDEFKSLVDAAHQAGLRVIMDLVHSHAVKNETEGLSRFDGTLFQYFHEGSRGNHLAWDTRCFDYAKPEVLHFLLSNCRFWLDEYHVDGFRFDGITSMLYLDHGLERAFMSYDHYFDSNVDEDALVYLALANKVIHAVNPGNISIAEDISGMPGLAAPRKEGGIGFDFRFAMGIPDYWIKIIKEYPDDHWPLETLWFELNNRRQDEKTISYCESHDQALVGDQTLIFRLIGSAIYDHMHHHDTHHAVDRGMAMHKIIRLITLATAGSGYLNFMGNEFGHPEWIDFPRQGNNWSYQYARRQWHLVDNENLKYTLLARFDREMIVLAKKYSILQSEQRHLTFIHENDQVIAFFRAGLLFVFGFHPDKSYEHYLVDAPPGKYQLILNSDDQIYGGHHRLSEDQVHFTQQDETAPHFRNLLSLYIPTRTAIVLKKI